MRKFVRKVGWILFVASLSLATGNRIVMAQQKGAGDLRQLAGR